MIMTTTTRALARPPKPERGAARRYTVLPDPPKKIDAIQFKHVTRAQYMLGDRYEGNPSTLVDGKMYLRQHPGERSGFAVPDCMIAFGVEADEIDKANGCVISEVGKPPDFILDIASKIVGVRDYTVKRRIYKDMKAPESWRFDPSGGRYHDAPLAGDILGDDGVYRPITIRAYPDGTFWGYSPALDLHLVWEEGWLRFYDAEVGEFLPTVAELRRAQEDAERLAAEANRRAARADQEAAAERDARIRADRRAVRADQEVAAEHDRAESERAARVEADLRAESERAARAEAERRAESERAARAESDSRAESERAARAESDRRAESAEAELERLRRLLGDLE